MKKEMFNVVYDWVMLVGLIFAYWHKDIPGLIFIGVLMINHSIGQIK